MIGLAIRRPVAVVMTFAVLAALGVASALTMPLELLPDVEFPRLEVTAFWPGASPELVEAFVTAPIEGAAQQVLGVRSVESTSYPQRAAVTIEFAPRTDMEFAQLDLSERLSALVRSLPTGAQRPEVHPYVPEEFAAETQALLVYTLAGPSLLGTLREYAHDPLAPELAAVEGVGWVDVLGGTERELSVRLDPALLSAYGLTPEDIRSALAAGLNVEETAATLRRSGLEYTVAIDDRAEGIDDVEELVLRTSEEGRPAVRLGDVARASLTYAEPFDLHRVDGTPAVSLYVHRQPGSNAIAVVDRMREELDSIRAGLPAEYRLIEDYDGSEEIRNQLDELRDRSILAAIVVFAVLMLALRRWRPALLAFASIVVSVLVTLDLMALAGLSLNLLTLAGLAMGIGLIDDNAIVVMEAIEARERELGRAARQSINHLGVKEGAGRVIQPVLAATVTNVIVFIPFLYLQGELRAYYLPFAVTVGLALLVSLAVAFTLIPAIQARIGAAPVTAGSDQGVENLREGGARRIYRNAVEWTVRHPWVTVGMAFLLLAGSSWLFVERVTRGKTWAGWGNETFLLIQISMPRGAELERTDQIAREVEKELRAIPEIDRFVTRVRPEYASIRVTFPDSLTHTFVPLAIKEELVAYSYTFGGAEVRVHGFGPTFYGGGASPPTYSLKLLGYSYEELERQANDLAERLRSFVRIRDVDPNASGFWFERDKETELILTLDRLRLAAYGLAVGDFLSHVSAFTRGQLVRDVVVLSGQEVGVSLEIEGARDANMHDLLDLVVTTEDGDPVLVSDVATIESRETLGRIIRENQQYQRIVSYEFRGPSKLGDRVRDAVLAATVLPSGYTIEVDRSFWEYDEGEVRQLWLVMVIAVLLVYMVTAALFESFRAPLVVLAAVPLALVGVFLVYFYLDETFTREAWIGVIMMAGIVVNNAILIVDRIGVLRRGTEGARLPIAQAAVEGTLDRVRPILMTTGTTVFGLLPLVLFTAPGTESVWRALALATIGGLVASTLLVLVTIPALYVLVAAGSADR